MAKLIVQSGVDAGKNVNLSGVDTSLGRSPANQVQLNDKRLSRFHAQITKQDRQYYINDMQSTNGTFLNGEQIFAERELSPNDIILIGNTEILFEMDAKGEEDPTTSKILVKPEDWGETRERVSASDSNGFSMIAGFDGGDPSQTTYPLRTLRRVTDVIRSVLDLDELLETIMEMIYDVFRPDRGVIFLLEGDELLPRVVKNIKEEPSVTVSQSIIEQALADRVSLLVSDTREDQRFSASESIVANRIRAALCAPLICNNSVLGVLYIDSQSRLMSYSKIDLELINSIAAQAAVSISNAHLHGQLIEQNRTENELRIARQIQMGLLPQEAPDLADFDIAALCLPAKKVGGDYYDFIDLKDNLLAIAVADVSGKGVPAAILSSSIRSALQVEARHSRQEIMNTIQQMNHMVCLDTPTNMFSTMVYGILDCKTRKFKYINAGHEYPLLYLPSKEQVDLAVGGPVLGVLDPFEFEEDSVYLPAGSLLVFYTDGVTDIQNEQGQTWGLESLIATIQENRDLQAEELVDQIHREAISFKGHADQFDDFTLIVIRSD